MNNPFFPEKKKKSEIDERKRKCPYCGHMNSYLELTCPKCFAYVYPEEEEALKLVKPEDNRPYNPLAITSLVLGVVGLLVCICYPLGIIDSIGAIILGYKARQALSKNNTRKGENLALWGIISGITGLAGSIAFAVLDAIWKISSLYN